MALLYFRMWPTELVGVVVISQTCYWKVPSWYPGHTISYYEANCGNPQYLHKNSGTAHLSWYKCYFRNSVSFTNHHYPIVRHCTVWVTDSGTTPANQQSVPSTWGYIREELQAIDDMNAEYSFITLTSCLCEYRITLCIRNLKFSWKIATQNKLHCVELRGQPFNFSNNKIQKNYHLVSGKVWHFCNNCLEDIQYGTDALPHNIGH